MTSARYKPPWMTDETSIFQKTVRQFIEKELAPHHARWAEQGHPDAEAWIKAGKMGLLLPDVLEEYGGGGGTSVQEAIVNEELFRRGVDFGFRHLRVILRWRACSCWKLAGPKRRPRAVPDDGSISLRAAVYWP